MRSFFSFHLSRRFLRAWERNWIVYKKNWKISFIPPLLEPLFYLLAFGIGMSVLVGNVAYRGTSIPYIQFIAPALISITIMYNAFFETTYSSYVRMYYQKTFHAIIATPLSLEEIITGEIVWGATKSVIATLIMMVVISAFGLIRYPAGLLLIPLSFVGGMAFGSLGMVCTGVVTGIDTFNLPIFLIITPMFLFSGTFFPIEAMPPGHQYIAHILPLSFLVSLARDFSTGILDLSTARAFIYLFLFGIILFPIALAGMRRRLIK